MVWGGSGGYGTRTIAATWVGVAMGHFDRTLTYIGDLQQAHTASAVCEKLIGVTSAFGLTALMAGTVPQPGTPIGRQKDGEVVMGDAGEFKLKDGLAFPLVTLDGQIVMVSLGGEQVEMSSQEFGMISLVATYAIGRAMQLLTETERTIDHIELTPRERECLTWAAAGKSEWEISQILGISEHTSEKHLLNAKFKLGAVNRVQAVAEAIRRGYI